MDRFGCKQHPSCSPSFSSRRRQLRLIFRAMIRRYWYPKQFTCPAAYICSKLLPSYKSVRRIGGSSELEQSPHPLGIGLGQWTEYGDNDYLYRNILESTLFRNNDIANTIEIGFLKDHDASFAHAYRSVVDSQEKLHLQPPLGETDNVPSEENMGNIQPSYSPPKIHILWRIGYRFEEITFPFGNIDESLESSSSPPVEDAKTNLNKPIDDPEAPNTSLAFLNDGSAPNLYPRRKKFTKKHLHDVVQMDEPPPTKIKLLQPPKLIHNLSPDYIHHLLDPNGKHETVYTIHPDIVTKDGPYDTPPLIQLKQDFPEQITLTIMLHNPESQLARYYTAQKQNHPSITRIPSPQDFLESMLYSSFQTLQQYCASSKAFSSTGSNETPSLIDGYGVISNGLSLPKDHPLHVSYHSILKAAKRVYEEDDPRKSEPTFRAIQLPANALETNGIHIAKQIQTLKQQEVCTSNGQPTYISNMSIQAIRPLTCYSDGGTGSSGSEISSKSHPFTLADYKIELKKDKKAITEWTNLMTQPPPAYNTAYQRAIQLFDAEEILEKQAERRREKQREAETNNVSKVWTELVKDLEDHLTDDERETLHGCILLQNMLQKLDSVLEDARSMKTHEIILGTEVIPTLRDKFESYDENTSYALEAYFTAYGKAMQYYTAKNTRQLLLFGESNKLDQETPSTTEIAAPTYDKCILPNEKRLQEFGIELLLNQTIESSDKDPTVSVFDVVMVGLSNPDEALDTIEIFKKLRKPGNPLLPGSFMK